MAPSEARVEAPPAVSAIERTLLVAALVLGTGWRVIEVDRAFLFGDELHSLGEISGGYAAILTTFGPTGSGMLLPLLQRALVDAFGVTHWAIRAPAILPSLALLYVAYPIALRVTRDRGAALVAVMLVAVNPLLVFYGHFARSYSLAEYRRRILEAVGSGL